MPQSKWERGFWASVRGSGSFKPYPLEHWRPKKNKKVKKRLKSIDFSYIDNAKQLTLFD